MTTNIGDMQLIIQSVANNPPSELVEAMGTVSAYAEAHDYEYKIFGDATLFGCVPSFYRKYDTILQTDIGRLFLMARMLNSYDKVIWFDADVHILDQRLSVPDNAISLADEFYVDNGYPKHVPANYIMAATKQKPLLELYDKWVNWAQKHKSIKWYSFTTEIIRKERLYGSIYNTANLSDDLYKRLLHGDIIPAMPEVYTVNLKTSTNSLNNTNIILDLIRCRNKQVVQPVL